MTGAKSIVRYMLKPVFNSLDVVFTERRRTAMRTSKREDYTFNRDDFTFDSERDDCVCPVAQILWS